MGLEILAGAAGNILGGLLQYDAQQDATAASQSMAERNIQLQKEFAQHGIRWKVGDAVAAGLHPLYALGANTQSFSPVSVGVDSSSPLGDMARNMGQDISRAVSAGRTANEREMAALQLSTAKTDLEGKALDNQIRLAQLKKLQAVGPAMPSSGGDAANFVPGQGDGSIVKVKPAERTASQPGRLAQEAGWRPDVSFSRTDTGLTPMVPESLSESLEDDIIGKMMWRFRNQLMPNLTGQGKPARSQLPRGADDWYWSHTNQEWKPHYKDSSIQTYMGVFNR